ncbi:hypothetical protein KIN20_023316 [Parelaphostrongylus tenuis]|uniref:Uncharacterized protein n=1 Tax=Parelaphostrongylus tenuis TaxID=148309 RepID=A0AAD5N709_PARTN|nr:hypothetical protein KIN20_023316 [Parelaphostrongylus tenuis]
MASMNKNKGFDGSVMEVPEHISVSGEPIERRERTDNSTPFLRQEESAVKLMNVPDHIALTGGDGYRAIISQPSDLIGSHMSHDKQWLKVVCGRHGRWSKVRSRAQGSPSLSSLLGP